MHFVGKIAALHRPVIDHREKREAEVGQQEKVTERVDQGFGRPGMLQFIEINDHPEHEHGGQIGRRIVGDDAARQSGPSVGQGEGHRANGGGTGDPGNRQEADAQEDRAQGEHDRRDLETEDPEQADRRETPRKRAS